MWGKVIAAGLVLASLGSAFSLWPQDLHQQHGHTSAVMAAGGVLAALWGVAYICGVRHARHALLHNGSFMVGVTVIYVTRPFGPYDPGFALALAGFAVTGIGGWYVQRLRKDVSNA